MRDQYFLKYTQRAQDRLKLQQDVFGPSSIKFVCDNGLKQGMRALEVACGPGDMTLPLASAVGPSGHLDSFDISPEFVSITKKKTEGKPWVHVHQSELFAYTSGVAYDFIYTQMILCLLKDPFGALTYLSNLLKPGGILVCEEPPASEGSVAIPASKSLSFVCELASSLLRKHKVQYDCAYKLPILFKSAGLKIINYNVVQPTLNQKERYLVLMGFEEMKDNYIREKMISPQEAETLQKDLEKELTSAEEVFFSRVFQCAGVKN